MYIIENTEWLNFQNKSFSFKLFEFNITNNDLLKNSENEYDESDYESENEYNSENNEKKIDNSTFNIQMFGINEEGKTASILVEEFKPFFYIKVYANWNQKIKNEFLEHLKYKVGDYYENSIVECKLIEIGRAHV